MGKGMGGHQSANSRTDEWITPPEIIQTLGPFDLDPCSPVKRPWPTAKVHYTIEDNGLLKPWFGRVWMNPPYSQLEIWMELLAAHNNGIALIYSRTDTNAFHSHIFPTASSIFFVKRRIYFYTVAGTKARFDGGAPSCFISYGEENSDALEDCGFKGKHVPLNQTRFVVVGVSPTWFSIVSIAVRNCGDEELKPVYDLVERLAPDKVVNNQHWKAKIRQQIQVIRKKQKTNAEYNEWTA